MKVNWDDYSQIFPIYGKIQVMFQSPPTIRNQKKHGGLAVERCLFLMAKGALLGQVASAFETGNHAAMPLHQMKILRIY